MSFIFLFLGNDIFYLPCFLLLVVSMLMFSSFEHTVDFLYQKIIQKKKEDCSTIQQLGATCLAGYISGAVGTVVSNPADNIVSSLYNKKAENIIHVSI